jgi:hypothetical protein
MRLLAAFKYRAFRAQADWTLTHTSQRDTEQSAIEASITLDGVTLTVSLIRWSPNEWPLVFREIPVSANKMFWTSHTPTQWTLYRSIFVFVTVSIIHQFLSKQIVYNSRVCSVIWDHFHRHILLLRDVQVDKKRCLKTSSIRSFYFSIRGCLLELHGVYEHPSRAKTVGLAWVYDLHCLEVLSETKVLILPSVFSISTAYPT